MTLSRLLGVYGAATQAIEAGGPAFLRWRTRRGKEDPQRWRERLGHSIQRRPTGPLAWVHGASVGEAIALLPLIDQLAARGFQILVTTGTVTSSRVLAPRLPRVAVHQFVPLDLPVAVRRFYDHWRPDLACFAESELWPNLLAEAHRRAIPAVLVNARMSKRSFARWCKMPALVRPLLRTFSMILAQSEGDAERFASLGGSGAVSAGNLKFDVEAPSADPASLKALQDAIGDRPVWVAASTHEGEDDLCCEVHHELARSRPGLLTIIVPRKADRGPAILERARALGLTAHRRSCDEVLDRATDIYVADTMGELGLFYRLARVVFVGKSLIGTGGQNPIEPAKLGAAILHGPHVENFEDVYALLDASRGSLRVADAGDLRNALTSLLGDPATVSDMATNGSKAVASRAGATTSVMRAMEPLIAAVFRNHPA